MMKKIQKFFLALIAKTPIEHLPIDHLVFLCGACAGIVLSTFGAISNHAMGLHWLSVLVPLINLGLDIACIVYSLFTERWRGAAVVVFFFASFVFFPFLWFTTGGTMSSSLPLVIGLGVVGTMVFSGKLRGFYFMSTLILYSSFIMIELHYPNNFIPYPNRDAWYTDVLFGFILSFLASGIVAYFTLMRYNAARRHAEALVQQLELISITDPLTGVYNRRHLMGRIDGEMRHAFDNGIPLSLCILDIDHFKSVNDNYGHLYGDEVLVKLASTIAGCLGEKEIFGRYGGEEFIIVFTGSDLQATFQIVDRFYEALRLIEWPHGKPITVSCGISTYSKGLSYSKFLESADSNLYKAKRNGRNRVEH